MRRYHPMRAGIIAAVAVAGLASARLTAQAADRQPEPLPRWEVGPYFGIARQSLAGTHFGVVPDRHHLFVGLQLTANVIQTRRWAFAYAPEVVPLLLVSNTPTSHSVAITDGALFIVDDGRRAVPGFAISPIGLQAQLRFARRWRPYVSAAAGVVWFTRPVPVAGARAFNYTFEFGGGVRWQYRPRESLRIGYKFHHLSNAYTASRNPGLDGAVFLIGYERAIGSRMR